MIDINLNEPVDEVRALVGDPQIEFVTDSTILSALHKYNMDLGKAAIAIMSLMLTAFSTLADREREGQVEVYYTSLFERYKKRFEDLKRERGFKKAIPIHIGGTSLKEKNKNIEALDTLSLYQLPDWHSIQVGHKTLVEQEIHRLRL